MYGSLLDAPHMPFGNPATTVHIFVDGPTLIIVCRTNVEGQVTFESILKMPDHMVPDLILD